MGSRSCAVDRVGILRYAEKSRLSEGKITSAAASQSFQWKFSFLSYIIILALVGVQNEGFATAGITLPVIRSFSQLEGSGAEEGSAGMTAEHWRHLRDHDHQRSLSLRRLLTTIANFPLSGNDYKVGLYYTNIGLGTPSGQYYVQVDTGSDLMWVNCQPCDDCPSKSDLGIPLQLYNPPASKTSKNSSCSSTFCQDVSAVAESSCVDSSCYYNFSYGDGSTAMGYIVQDTLTYDTVVNSTMSNASATVVFGCGFQQSGASLTSSSQAVDGIMGFGRQELSVVSQLAEQGLTTSQFAHCLQGDTGQGGIFVIGEVQEPGLVYTDLVANQYHYNVELQSISVGDVALNIPSSAFETYSNGDTGTIFDSGTTMALLVDTAYKAFVNQLTIAVSIKPVAFADAPNTPCFQYSSSDLSTEFPSVTLYFKGASMQLGPTNYLYKQGARGVSSPLWCLAWSPSSSSGLDGLSIFGDIVLKNKIVVYDLQNQRLGWVNYNCLSSINVSSGSGNQVYNPQSGSDLNSSPSLSLQAYHTIAVLICTVVVAYAASLW